jgi:hypothetical protein
MAAVVAASMILELVVSMELWRSLLIFGHCEDGSLTLMLRRFGGLVFAY